MKNKYIKIQTLNDIYDFVIKASKIQQDILVNKGKFYVDGKSILGMVYINASQGCTVHYPASATEFENYLKKFEN